MQKSTQSEHLRRLSRSLLTPDQQSTITRIKASPTLLVGDMGVGKTVIAATAIQELLDAKKIKRVLIISTPKIANTVWKTEFNKWEHLHRITVELATGDAAQRQTAFSSSAQVVVMTFNTLPWWTKTTHTNFDGLLIDESTKLKTPGGAGFKSLRHKLKNFSWRCAMTGTPVSENLLALYTQLFLVDLGLTLGTRFDTFRQRYFYPTDYKQYNWAVIPEQDKALLCAVAPHVHVMDEYSHELPPIEYEDVLLTLPPEVQDFYDELRKNLVLEAQDIVAANQAVLANKLAQVVNGWAYDVYGEPYQISDYRLHALKAERAAIEGNVIICYWYREDLARIKTTLADAVELTPANLAGTVQLWNDGKIRTLLIHPRSCGHGLQLERGGHTVIWYSPQWSRDLWLQTNARVWRRGQKHPVKILTLVADGTIDDLIISRVEGKGDFGTLFKKHLRNTD